MEPFRIKKAAFVTSVGQSGGYPEKRAAEIALVGRSNVGKSSLINCLTGNGKLARISAAPGKTRLVNYYLVNDSFYLVDLPGYGFAQRSRGERESWGKLMESYLTSGRVDHLLLLLDIRHEPTGEDRQMFQFLLYYGIPFRGRPLGGCPSPARPARAGRPFWTGWTASFRKSCLPQKKMRRSP